MNTTLTDTKLAEQVTVTSYRPNYLSPTATDVYIINETASWIDNSTLITPNALTATNSATMRLVDGGLTTV